MKIETTCVSNLLRLGGILLYGPAYAKLSADLYINSNRTSYSVGFFKRKNVVFTTNGFSEEVRYEA